MNTAVELNECPKCKNKTATSEIQGTHNRFYCTSEQCDFELLQEKQDREKAQAKLVDIKKQLFGN